MSKWLIDGEALMEWLRNHVPGWVASEIRSGRFNVKEPEPVTPDDEWFCKICNVVVDPLHVTYDERHDERYGGCGNYLD